MVNTPYRDSWLPAIKNIVIKWLLTSPILLAGFSPASADDWPQWRGPARDGVWREKGIVAELPTELTYRWRTPIGGGFAGPAVCEGRVYVMDRQLAAGETNPESRWDRTDPVNGTERVLCLDARNGNIFWKHEYACRYEISYPAGPRATTTIDEGRVYSLGAMGDLLCLDAETGKRLWSKNFVRDYGTEMNMWGMAAAPLVDGPRLIALVGGADGAGVVAWDKATGAELWRSLEPGDPGYAAPILIEAGGTPELIVWNPVGLHGLDPQTGKLYWQQDFPAKMGHSIATPIFDAETGRLFVSAFFDGPLMMQLAPARASARLLWKGSSQSELPQSTEGLHALMSTPAFLGGYLYGVCSYGHLRCLDPSTGRRVWDTLAATGEGRWSTAFLVRHEGRFVICNEQGELIFARLSPDGYQETSRARLIEPTGKAGRRDVVWSHPAFADRCVFARNDREIVCVDLAAGR